MSIQDISILQVCAQTYSNREEKNSLGIQNINSTNFDELAKTLVNYPKYISMGTHMHSPPGINPDNYG